MTAEPRHTHTLAHSGDAVTFAAAASAFIPALAHAHDGSPPAPHDLWRAWSLEPLELAGLALAAAGYLVGMRRLWRRSGPGRRRHARNAAAFAVGFLALVVALISPLDALGSALFSAHMLQHVVLMVVAAPLLVLARPLAPWLWALPPAWRRRVARALGSGPLRGAWRRLTHPVVAWTLHAAALWGWHAPPLFQATIRSDAVHLAQHASFFLTALLFWWVPIHRLGGAAVARAAGIPYIFTTAIHGSVLSALLTFSTTPWFPAYERTAASWGLTALEDQQLGGLIMWVPVGVVYVVAAIALAGAWLHALERDVARRDARRAPALAAPSGLHPTPPPAPPTPIPSASIAPPARGTPTPDPPTRP